MLRVALTRATLAALTVSLLLAAGATADERFPVRSEDDATQSFENRVGAIDNVLVPLDNRLERISADIQPGPPDDPELVGTLEGLMAEAHQLAVHADCFAAGVPIVTETTATAGTTIVDGDTFASDGTANGLANQATAIAIVLDQADARLVRISADWFQIQPGPPTVPVQDALAFVEADAYDLAVDAAIILGVEFPPNPNCPAEPG